MKHPSASIRSNAVEIERLRARIHELVAFRSRSAADREAWAAACAQFHTAFDDLSFPGGNAAWQGFIEGKAESIELAVAFVEADPHFFRSGYMKQYIWNRLKQVAVTADQEHRLEQVALQYLSKPIRREFWHMVRYARTRGSESFWNRISMLAVENDVSLSTRAQWLLLARKNFPVRNWVGRELLRAKYQAGYVPNFRFAEFGYHVAA
jgi:hypothetical protein